MIAYINKIEAIEIIFDVWFKGTGTHLYFRIAQDCDAAFIHSSLIKMKIQKTIWLFQNDRLTMEKKS